MREQPVRPRQVPALSLPSVRSAAGDRDFGHFQDADQPGPVHPVCKFATQTGGESGGENEHPRRERHDP